MKKIAILDQWATNSISYGTDKDWLYSQFRKFFDCKVINADFGFNQYLEKFKCLTKGIFTDPLNFKVEYLRNIECNSKYPRVFKERTERFARLFDKLGIKYDALFQAGCLFGPISCGDKPSFLITDQTVAIVERNWPDWLPTDFANYRDNFYELEKQSFQSKSIIFAYSEYTRKSIVEDYGIPQYAVVTTPTACKIPFLDSSEIPLNRQKKILFVTTDFFRKGGDIVFDSFKRIKQLNPEIRLNVIGGRIEEEFQKGQHIWVYCHRMSCKKSFYLLSCLFILPDMIRFLTYLKRQWHAAYRRLHRIPVAFLKLLKMIKLESL